MFGAARNLDEPTASAAALAVGRFKDLVYGLQAMRARLNPPRAMPRASMAGAPVIPTVRYRDVPAAIDWLCRAFGMKVHRTVTDANGAPCFAQLTIGSGMLMVAPIEDTPFGRLMVQPNEIGGVETQICYIFVANARAHYWRAKRAGAAIVLDLEDEANKGHAFSCRDLEGHVWNFGTYDPWDKRQPDRRAPGSGARHARHGLAAVLLLALALMSEAVPQPGARAGTLVMDSEAVAMPAEGERKQESAGPGIKDSADREVRVHNVALKAAEQAAVDARAQLTEIRGALEKAQREAAAARLRLHEMRRSKQSAERAAVEAREQLAAAQRTAELARQETLLERGKRLAADRAAPRGSRIRHAYSARMRQRTWCYDPNLSVSAWNTRGRLTGFCAP